MRRATLAARGQSSTWSTPCSSLSLRLSVVLGGERTAGAWPYHPAPSARGPRREGHRAFFSTVGVGLLAAPRLSREAGQQAACTTKSPTRRTPVGALRGAQIVAPSTCGQEGSMRTQSRPSASTCFRAGTRPGRTRAQQGSREWPQHVGGARRRRKGRVEDAAVQVERERREGGGRRGAEDLLRGRVHAPVRPWPPRSVRRSARPRPVPRRGLGEQR